jgi:hypothetical protein
MMSVSKRKKKKIGRRVLYISRKKETVSFAEL